MPDKRYRVAQWGTGHTGMRSLKCVIEHPYQDLVGCYVYTDAKAGRDAGDLCGTEPTGVIATRSIEDILAARPDCVLYMPRYEHASVDDICQLLEAGANIVTVVPDFHHVPSLDPVIRHRIEEACRRGGTSLYATGPSPGFSTEIFPLTMTALSRRIDCVTVNEFADMATRNSPELIAQMFGMPLAGMDVSQVAEQLRDHMGTSMRGTAEAWGLPLDEIVATGSLAAAAKTETIGVATIEAGTVAAWRFEINGMRKGKPLIRFCPTWYVTGDLDADWDIRGSGWHVVIEGDAPLDIDVRFTTENYGIISPGYNAHICVNAVANVCNAAPGIRSTSDLPPIIARFG